MPADMTEGRRPPGPASWTCCFLRATRHCNAASHLISSSSDGAQTRYVRFGVMILKACSIPRLSAPPPPPPPPILPPTPTPPPMPPTPSDEPPCVDAAPGLIAPAERFCACGDEGGGASYSIASSTELSGICRLNFWSCGATGRKLSETQMKRRENPQGSAPCENDCT